MRLRATVIGLYTLSYIHYMHRAIYIVLYPGNAGFIVVVIITIIIIIIITSDTGKSKL